VLKRPILNVLCAVVLVALSSTAHCADYPDGSARLIGSSEWVAGSDASFEIEYTVGSNGIPVGGSLVIAVIHPVTLVFADQPVITGDCADCLKTEYVEWPAAGAFPEALQRGTKGHLMRYGFFSKVVNRPLKPGEVVRYAFGKDGKGVGIARTICENPVRVAVDLKGDSKYYAIDRNIECKIVAGPAAGLHVTIPSTRTVGESADILVRAEDKNTILASVCNMRVKLSGLPGLDGKPVEVKNGLARVVVPIKKPGVFRVTVTGGGWSARSNPMVVTIKRPQYSVYWGDMHGHTRLSDGLAPDADAYYAYARDAADLDVCASAEHGFRPEARESTRKFNEPGRFVTIMGYEWSEMTPGRLDRNLYFHSEEDPIPDYPATIGELWKSVEKLYGDNKDRRIIVGPHMFTYKTKAKPWYETWDTRYERFAEIYSEHGMSEFKGNPRMLAGGAVADAYFVQDGLKYGRRFGLIGSSDTHDSHPGRGGNSLIFHGGIVAFLAKDLTRESVWDAWWSRRVYAATTDRISVDFRIDGHAMGEEFAASGKPRIEYTVHGCDDKFDVFLIKNNDVIKTTRATKGSAKVSLVDDSYDKSSYYYLRVVQDNGEWAWSSPIWVDKAE